MPGLDRLQQRLGGSDFEVVALSIDKGGRTDVEKFYRAFEINHLAVRVAGNSDDIRNAFVLYGIPTTFLLNRQGDLIGRMIGAANWDSDEMFRFLKNKIE